MDSRKLPQSAMDYLKLPPTLPNYRRLLEKQRPQSAVNLHPGNEMGSEQQHP